MARMYANENFPPPVVEELRRPGHEITTVQQAGRGGQRLPDEAVLAFAVAEGLAVLTSNRKHFVRLHRERPEYAGIVVCSVDDRFAELAARNHRRQPRPLLPLSDEERNSVDRVAIGRALIELGYLTIRRRRISPPISSKFHAKNSA